MRSKEGTRRIYFRQLLLNLRHGSLHWARDFAFGQCAWHRAGGDAELRRMAVRFWRRSFNRWNYVLPAKPAGDDCRRSATAFFWRPGTRTHRLLVPLAIEPILTGENSILNHPSTNWLYAIGRLKPGTNALALQSKLSAVLRHWMPSQPAYTGNGNDTQISKQHVVLSPAGGGVQNMQQEQGNGLRLLMLISGLVLLVACANVANLMLARAATGERRFLCGWR